MKQLTEIWTEEIRKLEMEVNTSKCKTMIVNNKTEDEVREIDINGKNLEKVTAYEYLGSVISEDGKIDLDIANRINKSVKIYYALNKTVFGKREIDMKTKLRVYNAIVVPILTYASESWAIKDKHEGKINAAEMKYLRKIAGKTKMDRERNESIRRTVQQEEITEKIEKKQLSWYGHIV